MDIFGELKSYYAGRRVLVTGHTGFKGSVLTALLGLLGARVYGYALKAPTDPSLFEIFYGAGVSSRNETNLKLNLPTERAAAGPECICESHIADIRDYDELEDFYSRINPEIVIHMAAQPIVRESYRIPRETYEVNVMGTVNVLECARTRPGCVSLLNVTTDKVYLNLETPGYAYKESDSLDGYDPYSNSKSCSELATHSYARSFLYESGTAVSTARAGNVIGGGDFAADRIIPDCVRAAMTGGKVIIRNPYSVRPYQHVFETAFGYLYIAMRQAEDPSLAGWYNIGPDRDDMVTTGELCDMFVRAYGRGLLWEVPGNTEGPHEAGLLLLDNSRAKEVLGLKPVWGVRKAVKAAASWTAAWLEGGAKAANEEFLRQIFEYTSDIGRTRGL